MVMYYIMFLSIFMGFFGDVFACESRYILEYGHKECIISFMIYLPSISTI